MAEHCWQKSWTAGHERNNSPVPVLIILGTVLALSFTYYLRTVYIIDNHVPQEMGIHFLE